MALTLTAVMLARDGIPTRLAQVVPLASFVGVFLAGLVWVLGWSGAVVVASRDGLAIEPWGSRLLGLGRLTRLPWSTITTVRLERSLGVWLRLSTTRGRFSFSSIAFDDVELGRLRRLVEGMLGRSRP